MLKQLFRIYGNGLKIIFVAFILIIGYWMYVTEKHFSDYGKIVLMIRQGSLNPDSTGNIKLPKELSNISCNGYVYQLQKYPGMTIFFPVKIKHEYIIGPDKTIYPNDLIEGYMYTEGPTPPSGWFDLQEVNPTIENVQIIRDKPDHGRFYYVEPFY